MEEGGAIGAEPPLSSPATSGSDSYPFSPGPLDKVGRQAGLLGLCVPGYDSQRSEGLPDLRLWELVLGIFTDKSFHHGGKCQLWGSMGLGTWARKKGEHEPC